MLEVEGGSKCGLSLTQSTNTFMNPFLSWRKVHKPQQRNIVSKQKKKQGTVTVGKDIWHQMLTLKVPYIDIEDACAADTYALRLLKEGSSIMTKARTN